jgi:hypothetical protein
MTIKEFIEQQQRIEWQQRQKTHPVTIRISEPLLEEIEELVSSLNITRQELLARFIESGLEEALHAYRESHDKPIPEVELTTQTEDRGYFVLNTNKRNNPDDHAYMLQNGVAAAFYDPWKFNIERPRKGDIIFLYESGAGIVAFGKASGIVEKRDKNGDPEEHYQQKLEGFTRAKKPLSAHEMKEITGKNYAFLQTMFKIKEAEDGEKIKAALVA